MTTWNEALVRARELTAGDGKTRFVYRGGYKDWQNPGRFMYSTKRPTRNRMRVHTIVNPDGSLEEAYGMRPMSVYARELNQNTGMYLGSIMQAFPECEKHLVETAQFVRGSGMAETVRQNGLMQSIYGLASCINRNA